MVALMLDMCRGILGTSGEESWWLTCGIADRGRLSLLKFRSARNLCRLPALTLFPTEMRNY